MAKIYSNLLRPLLLRVGTTAAVVLVGYGADADLANQIVTGAVAAILVGIELVTERLTRETE